MDSLKCLEEYFERFHQFNFANFSDIYNSLYTDYENLQSKIEFSLLINPNAKFDLRFGLFKLYDTQRILSVLEKMDYEYSNLKRILSSVKDSVPEFALGFDFNNANPRIKVYFLRLPDNPKFKEKPIESVKHLSELVDIDLTSLDGKEIESCYLMAMDFYKDKVQNLKVYTKDTKVDFSRINDYLKKNSVASQHLGHFQKLFSNGEVRDVTFSKKYSGNLSPTSGFSIFFDASADACRKVSCEEVKRLVQTCAPERFSDFDETVKTLDACGRIDYSNIGLTFSEHVVRESICLYFSPCFGSLK